MLPEVIIKLILYLINIMALQVPVIVFVIVIEKTISEQTVNPVGM